MTVVVVVVVVVVVAVVVAAVVVVIVAVMVVAAIVEKIGDGDTTARDEETGVKDAVKYSSSSNLSHVKKTS